MPYFNIVINLLCYHPLVVALVGHEAMLQSVRLSACLSVCLSVLLVSFAR